jgi:hypothetical protein
VVGPCLHVERHRRSRFSRATLLINPIIVSQPAPFVNTQRVLRFSPQWL